MFKIKKKEKNSESHNKMIDIHSQGEESQPE